jgi:nucleoside phosphorylase
MAAEQTFGLTSGTLQVFEARFGDKDGALALLEYPSQMREFFLQLSHKADLPDSAPPGAVWAPFVRGWRQDDYFIITLTEADHTAVRPGMIATRMLAIALADVEKLDDVGGLFEMLHESYRDYAPWLTVPASPTKPQQTVPPALLACVAYHLIHEDKPAAIIGQNEFEGLVAALWQKLPRELRRTFRFGFSFTPTDLTVTQANIVGVPASCEARWSSYKFKCDANWNQPISHSLAAFLSDPQAHGFLDFLQKVGLVFHSFSDYGRYARLWSYWQKRGEDDLEIAHALLRSLGTLLPDPDQASNQKEEAMSIAARLLQRSTEEDILALRSVKALAFPSNAAVLERAVCVWLESRIQAFTVDNGTGLSKIVLALPSSQSAEWQQWIRKGLKQEFASLSERAAQAIWSVWKAEGTLDEIGDQLPTDATTEQALVRACPISLPAKLFLPLAKWSVNRGWICLMAKAALTHVGFPKAISLVFDQNGGKPRTAAIELLCAGAKSGEVWLSAFTYDDPMLIECAVAAAKAEPVLWNSADADISRWLVLLEASAKTEPNCLREIDSNAITARLFEAWAKGAPISEAICEALEKAGRLEFNNYENRCRLWPRLPKRYLASSLSNTLKMWLKEYYSRPPTKPNLEKELIEILFAPQHINFTFPRNSPFLGLGGLMLVEAWGTERHCESWLNAVIAAPTELYLEAAQRAGDLVTSRHWGNMARTAKESDERIGRHDVRVIWQTYYDSLGRLEKFAFDYFPNFSRRSSTFLIPTESKPMIDAVFVTALPEEFSAVRSHLADRQEHTEKGTIYEIGRFGVGEAGCTVAIVQTGMGNSLSAAATERVLNLFKPTFAFFVGIAGGLRDDLKIGDVVAASKVYGYEGGKSGATFQPRPDAPPVSHAAEQRANAVVRDKTWQNRITPFPHTIPDAIVRPIAAGEKVLVSESSEDLKRVRATYTDAYAVAMEDHGFATAIRGHPSVCFAVVRGISDLIENKKEADRTGSHEIAARNAAAFAFEMLAGLLRGRANSVLEERPFID